MSQPLFICNNKFIDSEKIYNYFAQNCNNKNLFDFLHENEDIATFVFSCFTYEKLRILALVCKKNNKIIQEVVKYKLRISSGYPRACGHCHMHYVGHIPEKYLLDLSVFEEENSDYSCWGDENGDVITNIKDREEFALKIIQKRQTKLIKGDLIIYLENDRGYRNDFIDIYDGTQIIKLYDEIDDYGSCIPSLKTLENEVPIGYWLDYCEKKYTESYSEDEKKIIDDIHGGIEHNSIMWINLNPYIKQCLNNLTYEIINYCDTKMVSFYMWFQIQDEKYYIILNGCEITAKKRKSVSKKAIVERKNTIKNKFSEQDLSCICFTLDPVDSGEPKDFSFGKSDCKVLYLHDHIFDDLVNDQPEVIGSNKSKVSFSHNIDCFINNFNTKNKK